MLIWALFAGLTACAVLFVVVPLARHATAPTAEEGDVSVYRDQLAEIDRDRDAGMIGATEAEAARAEISRRLLRAADRRDTGPADTPRRTRVVAAIVIVLVPLLSVGLYLRLGRPDMPDAPLVERLAARSEDQSIEVLVARVEAHLAQVPDDVRGWDVLGPIYMRLERPADSARAWKTAIRLGGLSEKRAVGLGEALVAAGEGTIDKEAQAAFADAVRVAPTAVLPRMYLAAAALQEGRTREGVEAWRALVASGTDADPWMNVARGELAKAEAALAAETGAAPTPAPAPAPTAAPGPTAAEVDAAAEMPAADRAKMVADMVARLDERLRSAGGTIEEWERLIRARRVMGDEAAARDALERARTALAADAAAIARLDALAAGR